MNISVSANRHLRWLDVCVEDGNSKIDTAMFTKQELESFKQSLLDGIDEVDWLLEELETHNKRANG